LHRGCTCDGITGWTSFPKPCFRPRALKAVELKRRRSARISSKARRSSCPPPEVEYMGATRPCQHENPLAFRDGSIHGRSVSLAWCVDFVAEAFAETLHFPCHPLPLLASPHPARYVALRSTAASSVRPLPTPGARSTGASPLGGTPRLHTAVACSLCSWRGPAHARWPMTVVASARRALPFSPSARVPTAAPARSARAAGLPHPYSWLARRAAPVSRNAGRLGQ
jgi:hypothetical protein